MISTLSSSPDPSPNKGSGGNWTEDACRSNGPRRINASSQGPRKG